MMSSTNHVRGKINQIMAKKNYVEMKLLATSAALLLLLCPVDKYSVYTPQPVMCGALVCSCMRYGVWDTEHLKADQIPR